VAVEAREGRERAALQLHYRDPQRRGVNDELVQGGATLRNDEEPNRVAASSKRLLNGPSTGDQFLVLCESLGRLALRAGHCARPLTAETAAVAATVLKSASAAVVEPASSGIAKSIATRLPVAARFAAAVRSEFGLGGLVAMRPVLVETSGGSRIAEWSARVTPAAPSVERRTIVATAASWRTLEVSAGTLEVPPRTFEVAAWIVGITSRPIELTSRPIELAPWALAVASGSIEWRSVTAAEGGSLAIPPWSIE
jgi:hypothetical protein